MARRHVGLVAAAAVALALIVVALVVAQSSRQRASVNDVAVSGPITRLVAGATICQRGELVLPGTASVRFYVGAQHHARASLVVTIAHGAGTPVTRGSVAGAREGFVLVPVAPVHSTVPDASVCLTNRGAGWLEVGGLVGTLDRSVTVAGRAQPGRARIDYFRAGSERAVSRTATVATRFGLGKAGFLGTWTLWTLLAIMVASLVLAGTLVRSALREEIA